MKNHHLIVNEASPCLLRPRAPAGQARQGLRTALTALTALAWLAALLPAAQAQQPLVQTEAPATFHLSAPAQTSSPAPLALRLNDSGTAAQVRTPHVHAQLLADAPQGIAPGRSFSLGLLINHAPQWHTYWQNPGDSGMATELHWQLPGGWQASGIAWPVPQKLRIGELANYGYEQQVLLPVHIELPADWQPPGGASQVEIGLEASWLACRLECIPEQGSFRLSLPLDVPLQAHAAQFAQARAELPLALPDASGSAAAQGQRLSLRVHGLPAALHGQQLEVFAQQPQVIAHGARAGRDWQQRWEQDDWVAELPLSPERENNPAMLDVLLTPLARSEGGQWDPQTHDAASAGPKGWAVQVPVTSGWRSADALALPAADAPPAAPGAAGMADAGAGPGPRNSAAGTAAPAQAAALGWSLPRWGLMLLLAMLGGAVLNLMPCVFPVLAIKALALARYGKDRTAQRQSAWAYGAGVVLSFAAMGALVMALRAGGAQLGWGFQLQSPWFVAALTVLFTVMGLALAGVIGLQLWLPAAWRGGSAPGAARSPVLESLGAGVIAVLVASPCTGPFLGAALGATLSLPAWAALAIFVAIGVGMALPFMALVWFPALLDRLPRPGAWMETFRTAMAFPMFATVVWLLWVLASQVGSNAMIAWLFALWALCFALWLLGKRPALQRGLALQALWLLALAVPLAVAASGGRYFSQSTAAGPEAQALGAPAAAQGWQPWSAQAQEQALAAGQPVFVDFTASWCITCQYNKATTLADTEVLADFRAAGVRLLRADWSRQNPDITAELQALQRNGVPTYALHVPGQPPQVLTEILDKQALRAQLQALR
ncbi:MAG: protein-disulfide reductase DsbD family protein [Comamonadaceae bacterium]|nr:protein-disulfide reductase DsbD family protein [Comamonadaceae bacterium]